MFSYEVVVDYAHETGTNFVTVGCDSDSLSSKVMISRLCNVSVEVYGRVNLINVNAATHFNLRQCDTEGVFGKLD